MPATPPQATYFYGLSENDVLAQRLKFGTNDLKLQSSFSLAHIVWNVVREPMFVMLVTACLLYFLLGQTNEGFMMLAAMFFVTAISVYQEAKGSNALRALQKLTDPKVIVIREGKERPLNASELVPNDIVLLEEGALIAADARIIQQNDITVNESILTGESLPVVKSTATGQDMLYQGTLIHSGKCYATVTATGAATALGKLGKTLNTITQSKTLLQHQIEHFLKRFTLFGLAAFGTVFIFNYVGSHQFINSLLFSLTLAMSVLPEEIPVAFSSFMALGAYHLSKMGIITKQPQVVENLGAVSIICLDKTGTITENKMQVESIYAYETDQLHDENNLDNDAAATVLWYALLASETTPFDPMEKAIWQAYLPFTANRSPAEASRIHEYQLNGSPPMMTHVYLWGNEKVAAGKGAVERLLNICGLQEAEVKKILKKASFIASKGCRVLGVASAIHTTGPMPSQQDDFNWQFRGLLSLYDPPKKNIKGPLQQFYAAGIAVKLLTGDHPLTALNIAGQVGLVTGTGYVTGDEVLAMPLAELYITAQEKSIFARMNPEAKLRVIEALKANSEIVAMTGDGVNDGPALKAANIGIAMGKQGTEIARQSADLVLTDDNLEKVADAIRHGRKIFSNFKKAVRYIISIHIPIILIASLPVVLGWRLPNIFTPIHVIFLELIMGPTCSIFFEREPAEEASMEAPPRKQTVSLFTRDELLISCVQGSIIAASILLLYHIYMANGAALPYVRTLVFTTLVLSNIFLTFVNRSFTETLFKTVRYKNNLALPVLLLSLGFLALIHLAPFVRSLFGMLPLSQADFFICFCTAAPAVFWFEMYKMNLHEVLKNLDQTSSLNTAPDHPHTLP